MVSPPTGNPTHSTSSWEGRARWGLRACICSVSFQVQRMIPWGSVGWLWAGYMRLHSADADRHEASARSCSGGLQNTLLLNAPWPSNCRDMRVCLAPLSQLFTCSRACCVPLLVGAESWQCNSHHSLKQKAMREAVCAWVTSREIEVPTALVWAVWPPGARLACILPVPARARECARARASSSRCGIFLLSSTAFRPSQNSSFSTVSTSRPRRVTASLCARAILAEESNQESQSIPRSSKINRYLNNKYATAW